MATLPARNIPTKRSIATATVSTEADGLSDVIDLGGHTLCSVEISSSWTAASMTFKASASSSGLLNSLYTSTGSEVTFSSSAGLTLIADPAQFSGLRYLQLRSGTAAVPVAQAAVRSVILGLAPMGQIK